MARGGKRAYIPAPTLEVDATPSSTALALSYDLIADAASAISAAGGEPNVVLRLSVLQNQKLEILRVRACGDELKRGEKRAKSFLKV